MLIYSSAQNITEPVRLYMQENPETLVGSARNDGRSIFEMFLTVLHVVLGFDT